MASILGNPAFYLTYAVVQAVVVLLVIRLLDLYERQPLALVGLVAVWGATGAPAIALVGNRAVRGLLSDDAQYIFGNAIAPPLVEEAAKGLALLAAVGPIRWLARRFGVALFEGLTAGVVYGAAVGLGFALTEDLVFFFEEARVGGVQAGLDEFLFRRDFFGLAGLHHPLFTAAFGAGLGLAAWSARWAWRVLLPLAGFAVAVLLHAANNGLVELVLVLRYGMDEAEAWARGTFVIPAVDDTASTVTTFMKILDFYAIGAFLVAMALWLRHERNIIRRELAEEVEAHLLTREEWEAMFRPWQRSVRYWRLVRSGQLERWRLLRRVHSELARLALLKWRARRSEDWTSVQRARRRVAALAAYDLRPTSLPVPSTPLVGRERELDELRKTVSRAEARLVTLTGPGGTGKSRLSLELASQLQDRYGSGVFFVELAAVAEPDLVASTIAQTLELREAPGESAVDCLEDYLRDKQLLLVLDNFEHVVAAAPVIAGLLASAPRLTALVTSRQPLRIGGEVEYPVPPLALPDPETGRDAAALLRFESVALFVERARAADPVFELTGDSGPSVAEICRRLDGLPLAIELAAARVKFLPPQVMLERLKGSLELVGTGGSDRPERHQTLRAAIEWSYGLLAEPERLLLARLGVFSGGWTLEAVEDVCAEGLGADVLATLESLVDKSLVRRDQVADGLLRFALLESIREYARERLARGGELAELEARHAEYFVRLAEEAEPQLAGPRQDVWVRRLAREHDNLRAALAWTLGNGRAELGVLLASALGRFWEEYGSVAEPRRWFEAALASGATLPGDVRARALRGVGRLCALQGDYDEAGVRIEEALELFRGDGDRRGEAVCLWELGWIHLVRGHRDEARAALEQSLATARALDDAENVARALASLGRLLAEEGETGRARALAEESLAIRRALEDTRGIANSLSILGRVALLAGAHEEATRLLEESSSLARGLGDALRLAEALYFHALAARELGDPDADVLLHERTMLCRDLGDKLGLAECLEFAAAGEDDPRRAVTLFAAAARMRESLGAPQWPFERSRSAARLDEARAALADEEFEAGWSEGAAMSRERSVSFMVEEGAGVPLPSR